MGGQNEGAEEYAARYDGVTWFGESWGAEVNRLLPHVEAPDEQPCDYCGVVIEDDDRGVTLPSPTRTLHFHLGCWSSGILQLGPQRPPGLGWHYDGQP